MRKAKTKDTVPRTTPFQWLSIVVTICLSGAVVGLVSFFHTRCTPSQTSFEIVRADQDAVYVLVSNEAPRNPSHIVEASLDFDGFPLENATLEPIVGDENKEVIDPGHITVGLTPRGLGTKMKPTTSELYTKNDILAMLKDQSPQRQTKVTLWIKVKESNGVERPLSQSMTVFFIRELINEKLTDRGI